MRRNLACLLATLALTACGKGFGNSDSGSDSAAAARISVANNRALLSWSASSGLPDGYYVEQSSDGTTWNQIQDVTETSTYLDGLSAGSTYYFRVRSHNSSGNSAYSGLATLTP